MSQEDDLRGLARVMDFMRALSILFIIINSFLQYGMDNGFISSFTSNIRRIDCFEILRAVICYGLYVAVIFWAKNSNIDRYTTRKKKIEKMICRKVKAYDKRNDKYVY